MDWYEDDTILEIQEKCPPVIVFSAEVDIWGVKYFAPVLAQYILENYQQIDEGSQIWTIKMQKNEKVIDVEDKKGYPPLGTPGFLSSINQKNNSKPSKSLFAEQQGKINPFDISLKKAGIINKRRPYKRMAQWRSKVQLS